jgi:RNA-directed DNA polymerase
MGKGGSGFEKGRSCNAARRAAEWQRSGPVPEGPWSRVAGMQAKLHRWAAADPGRRFDDLFNLVHDPATLYVAFCRVAGNRGANTPGVDGMTVRWSKSASVSRVPG